MDTQLECRTRWLQVHACTLPLSSPARSSNITINQHDDHIRRCVAGGGSRRHPKSHLRHLCAEVGRELGQGAQRGGEAHSWALMLPAHRSVRRTMLRSSIAAALLAVAAAAPGCMAPAPASTFDLSKFYGTWYEIGRVQTAGKGLARRCPPPWPPIDVLVACTPATTRLFVIGSVTLCLQWW